MLMIGGLMAAAPTLYLSLRNRLPGLHPVWWPRQSSDGGPELRRRWRIRTRTIGVCLVALGVMILRAASRGEIPEADPFLFWRP